MDGTIRANGTHAIRSERDTFLVTEEVLRRLGPQGARVCKSAAFRLLPKRANKNVKAACADANGNEKKCEKPIAKAQVVEPESRPKPEESKYH